MHSVSGMTNGEKCALDLMEYGKYYTSILYTGGLILKMWKKQGNKEHFN